MKGTYRAIAAFRGDLRDVFIRFEKIRRRIESKQSNVLGSYVLLKYLEIRQNL